MKYKFSFYAPPEAVEAIKEAMFKAGAGRIGDYEACAWQTKGQGQFRPLADASPSVGRSGRLERVEEFLVEMVCAEERLKAVFEAFKRAHPYEEPAYAVVRLEEMR